MNKQVFVVKACAIAATVILAASMVPVLAEDVYVTDFDSLALGTTQGHPGDPNQDNWYMVLAAGDAYGEIQDLISNGGRALHEHTDVSNPTGEQTIDARALTPPDLSAKSIITLSVDFYCVTSEQSYLNSYSAGLKAAGGPHPGFEILALRLDGGNGTPKSDTGVNVGMGAFDGVGNHFMIPLTVGQQLAWDTWHSVTIVADQANDTYVSITVNGQTQDLAGYQLPRNFDGVDWLRGQLIESLSTEIVPADWPDQETDDDVYWDNLSLTATAPLPIEIVDDFDDYDTGPLSEVSDGFWRTYQGTGLDPEVVTGGLSNPNATKHVGGPPGGVMEVVSYTSRSLLNGPGSVVRLACDFYMHDEGPEDMDGAIIWVGTGDPNTNEIDANSGLAVILIDWSDGVGVTSVDLWDVAGPLGGGDWGIINMASDLAVDQWHHVELVATQTVLNMLTNDPNEADGALDFYLNGELAASDLPFGVNDLNYATGLNVIDISSTEGLDGMHDDYLLIDNMTLTHESDPCPDLDGDGDVGLADLAQLLAHFGQSGMIFEQGDINGDGDVDLSDLAALLALFGTTC